MLTSLRTLACAQAKHAAGEHSFGVDGETGKVVDMKDHGLYESAAVKVQTLKTAIEVSSLPECFALNTFSKSRLS